MNEEYQLTMLVCKTVSGDREAFEQLIRLKMKAISYKIRAFTGAKHFDDEDDIFQTITLRIFEKIGTLKAPEAFGLWLNTVIKRECLRYLKAKKVSLPLDDPDYCSIIPSEKDADCLPFAHVEKAENLQSIREALCQLSDRARTMVIMYYSHEKSYKDIAHQMGLSIGSVSANLFRAKNKLREELQKL